MSTVLAFQHRRLIRAAELSDRHMRREVRIGNVEGVLVALDPRPREVVVVLMVGQSRALFELDPSAAVEVGRKP
jgi:hypothetical protein